MPLKILTDEQIQSFVHEGVIVIPNVLTTDEISKTRRGLHTFLRSSNCNPDNLDDTASSLQSLSTTGGSGGVLDIFYEDWKLDINQNQIIFDIFSDLWSSSYCDPNSTYFKHPFGQINADRGYMYIDRVCYRVPEVIAEKFGSKEGKKMKKLQRSLTPHLDCCPHKLYDFNNKEYPKWKPIQAFIALTDTIESNMGGFEACPGFHHYFEEWTQSRLPSPSYASSQYISSSSSSSSSADMTSSSSSSIHIPTPPCIGDFTPIRPVEDQDVIAQFRHIPCKAGDLVCWDYRIPHANSRYNLSSQAREVIYLGFLPDIEMNKRYTQEQLRRLRLNRIPTDQWHASNKDEKCSFEFNELGRKLMTIDEWS